MTFRMSCLVLLATALVLPAAADTRITTSVDVTNAEPAAKTTWFGDNRIREDQDARSVIIDLDAGRLVLVDHDAKTYQSVELPLDIVSLLPDEARAAYESMLERMAVEVSVSSAVETGDVAGFAATRYDATLSSEMMGEVVVEVWVSDAVPVDIATYKAMMFEMADLQPAAGAWMKRLLEIDGYPVRIVTRAEAGDTTFERVETVTAVEEADAPAGFYDAPEGYKERPFDPVGDMTGS